MLINNEKWACDACIRGHRVSSCHHSERELHKVAPKGRPVSQCPHCRGARKARAQHVACNCAEKGHTEGECPSRQGDKLEPHTCCCSHGARCACSSKKDHRKDGHLDTVPEDAMSELPTPDSLDTRSRSSLTTPPESKMTAFANGHHKPVHKHNDAAHTRGLPYTIPRTHSVHGHAELAQRSVDSLPHTKRSLISHDTPLHHDSVTSAPQPVRMAKSEHGSPELLPADVKLLAINTASPGLDPTYSPYGVLSGTSSPITNGYSLPLPDQFPESYFTRPSSYGDFETPLHSAGLTAPSVDWDSFNLPCTTSGEYNAAPSQPRSYASFDYNHEIGHPNHPGLTSSSGELSEAEEYPALAEAALTAPSNAQNFGNADVRAGDLEPYRLGSPSSITSAPQPSNAANLLTPESTGELDIDEFIRRTEAQTRELEAHNLRAHASSISSVPNTARSTPPISVSQDMPPHGLTVREAQNFAHMNSSDGDLGSIPGSRGNFTQQLSNTNGEDPMWSAPDLDSPEEVRWDA